MHTTTAEISAVRMTAQRRDYVDFARVPVAHWRIDDRLTNWARWCRGASGEGARIGKASPMFSGFRSSEARRAYGDETSVPIDKMDAQAMQKAVTALPGKHRAAIHWHYLDGRNPSRAAAGLGVSHAGLAQLVMDGRQMLVNRKA